MAAALVDADLRAASSDEGEGGGDESESAGSSPSDTTIGAAWDIWTRKIGYFALFCRNCRCAPNLHLAQRYYHMA